MGFQEVTHRGDVPQQVQVAAHHGFKTGVVHTHTERITASEAPRTLQLAKPPAWTEVDKPCDGLWDLWDETRGLHSEERAEALCKGCPVIEQCLEAAMAEEVDIREGRATKGTPLGAQHRYGIRGGLTPKGRARKALGEDVSVQYYGDCRNGHRVTDETSRLVSNGRGNIVRRCLTCIRANERKQNARRLEARTACKYGHEFVEGSFTMRPSKHGLSRYCLVCNPPKEDVA